MGDIGFRPLNSASAVCPVNDDRMNSFEDWSINAFEVEAVMIGEISRFMARVETREADSWLIELGEITVTFPGTQHVYSCNFDRAFTQNELLQTAKCSISAAL